MRATDWAWPNVAYFRKFVKSLQLRTVSDATRERLNCAVAVPFDHLTRYAIHDFRSFSRLCGGPHRPLSFDKLVRPYQPPALYANLKGAKGAIAAQYPPPTFLAS